jgi:uncharacterized protein (DUF2267 family)
MTFAGLDSIATAVQKTNELLEDIEGDLGWQGNHSISYQALRAVLHTVRDRLPVIESAQFAAQLPILVRGLYYEGWVPSRVPIKMDRAEFLERVRKEFTADSEHSIDNIVSTVITNIAKHVSVGELKDIRSVLPEDINELLKL